ncbi:MAG: phytanoyl-CoA dioxygenase family protein [Acidobacteria bacterium]|nr:phytanoyl-CoA dioxygenase family protein [Acidobacteriota bacterium]MDA1234708.1 phytanoyl-CoA dioxygenase family protein [Acidobacteriota bacterium]
MHTPPVSKKQAAELDSDGFTILPQFLTPAEVDAFRQRIAQLFDEEGYSAGSDFKLEPGAKRLANLVNKGSIFQRAFADSSVLALVRQVLGRDIKLSSLNARSAIAGGGSPQPLHADMGAVPDEKGYWVCNVVWMLDDFTEVNGALRAVPGSHRSGRLPQQALADPFAAHPGEVLITGESGDVVVMNAHLWHAGTENRAAADRLALHSFFCRHDKPQQQYQKKLLAPAVQSQLSPELRDLLALDDPLNDVLSSQDVVRSGFMK